MRPARVIGQPAVTHGGMETDQERTRRGAAIDRAATYLATVIDHEPMRPAMAMHQRGIALGMVKRGTGMRPETVSRLPHE